MSCSGTSGCTCGCCSGTSVQTPQTISNPRGLPAISYRTGTWATFKESMLARLSSSDYPALAGLKTRDDDDFTIALLDATAVVLDILTFYQERLANESYLRTATQLRSLTELSRLIGYRPAPGVSASTYLAFTLKTTPGQAPDPATAAITIPQGTQVQSVPAQGQKPQTFETAADIPAKPDWNALPVLANQPWIPVQGDTSAFLSGTSTNLQPGDALLFVGDERLNAETSGQGWNIWDLRVVLSVATDTQNNQTLVIWNGGLGGHGGTLAQQSPKIFALRQRAALFGYSALNPLMLTPRIIGQIKSQLNSTQTDWNFGINSVDGRTMAADQLVDLDAVYPKVVSGGWLVLICPDDQNVRSPSGFVSLYNIQAVTVLTRSDYAMSSKVSRLATDTATNLSTYYQKIRTASALAQSEELPTAPQPLTFPLYGTVLDLATLRPDLANLQVVALSGNRQKIAIAPGITSLSFIPDDGSVPSGVPLNPGDILTITDGAALATVAFPPPNANGQIPVWSSVISTTLSSLNVEDANGRTGIVQNIAPGQFVLSPSAPQDLQVSEYALVSSVAAVEYPYPHTQIQLANPLIYCYDRATTAVNANVAPATHGQSVTEIMGSGSAATPNQSFTLKQSPLTYVQAPTPSGRLSTLEVSANQVSWTEVASLYQQAPNARVYATQDQSDGTTDALFGDGVEGATLPTGQNNIQANYRIGSGLAGNLPAGALTTLLDRPLGVNGVTNPSPATGGQDPQSVSDIRTNAPQGVLTLGRAVSITDYQNYAATFAGIAKANAIYIPSGPARGVFLTVAAAGGTGLPPGDPTLKNLVNSLQNFGNPFMPIFAASFVETLFGLSASVAYDPAYDQPAVQAGILQALSQTYTFAQRTFGQSVTADEISSVIQGVPGVVAVNLTNLSVGMSSTAGDLAGMSGGFTVSNWNQWIAQPATVPRPCPVTPQHICAYLPVANPRKLPAPAEILVLDPNPTNIVLSVMT